MNYFLSKKCKDILASRGIDCGCLTGDEIHQVVGKENGSVQRVPSDNPKIKALQEHGLIVISSGAMPGIGGEFRMMKHPYRKTSQYIYHKDEKISDMGFPGGSSVVKEAELHEKNDELLKKRTRTAKELGGDSND